MTNIAFTKDYSDLDFSLAIHPSYGDILPVKGYKAIRQSVKNLILMSRNSRPFQPYLTSAVPDFLFEQNDMFTKVSIIEEVERVLKLHEPRVSNVFVEVQQNVTELNVRVTYNIVNASKEDTVNIEIQKLS